MRNPNKSFLQALIVGLSAVFSVGADTLKLLKPIADAVRPDRHPPAWEPHSKGNRHRYVCGRKRHSSRTKARKRCRAKVRMRAHRR